MSVQQIREGAEYPGLRVRLSTSLGGHRLLVAWDISTGGPIIPAPQLIQVPRILGKHIPMLGYAPETIVAEKGVTILERGITSTRWRDYIDIERLSQVHGLDDDLLLKAAQAVARHRQVALGPKSSVVAGYGAVGQAKWAAWRRKEHLESISEADLDDQIAQVPTSSTPCSSTDPPHPTRRRARKNRSAHAPPAREPHVPWMFRETDETTDIYCHSVSMAEGVGFVASQRDWRIVAGQGPRGVSGVLIS